MNSVYALQARVLRPAAALEFILDSAIQVAERHGDHEAFRWLNEERQGYMFSEQIPDYRRVVGKLRIRHGNAWHEVGVPEQPSGLTLVTWLLDQSAVELERLSKEVISIGKPVSRAAVLPHVGVEVPLDAEAEVAISADAIREVLSALRRRIYQWAVSIPMSHSKAQPNEPPTGGAELSKGDIFIVHGHNHTVRDQVDLYLTKELGLRTVVMEAGPMRGMTMAEKFETAAKSALFAVFILTADDVLSKEAGSVRRVRQNVLLEIGYFWGLLGRRDRVAFLVENHPDMELPTDIQGIGWIPITSDLAATKTKLREELIAAGVLVNA